MPDSDVVVFFFSLNELFRGLSLTCLYVLGLGIMIMKVPFAKVGPRPSSMEPKPKVL